MCVLEVWEVCGVCACSVGGVWCMCMKCGRCVVCVLEVWEVCGVCA